MMSASRSSNAVPGSRRVLALLPATAAPSPLLGATWLNAVLERPFLAALPELVPSGTRPPLSRNQCSMSGINSWSDANYWLARSSVRKAVPESFSVFRRDGPFARPAFELRPLWPPLVAAAIGLWLGSPSLDTKLGPIRMLLRLVFLFVLSFWCLSNTWTGYPGPSCLPPERFPETALRF